MIDWNKYFDHIFVLSRCSNFDRRVKLLAEFARIGLSNYTIIYQPDSELLDYDNTTLTKERYRCKYAHYHCCKMSYELGYDNICILEDDMIFLKDINEIENQLEIFLRKKNESDIYMFDYIIVKPFDCLTYYLADFYWLNRKGMQFMIYISEHYKNIMNDAIFLDNYKNVNSFIFYYYNNEREIINLPEEEHILPLIINISPIRICVQSQIMNKENTYKYNYDLFKNEINNVDKNLYNISN